MVVDVIAAVRRVGQRSVSGGRESQKCVIVNDSVAQFEWYVSHRRGLRIWGLSSNAGPRPSSYQDLPSGTNHGENLFRPLTKCLDNILPHKVLLEAKC